MSHSSCLFKFASHFFRGLVGVLISICVLFCICMLVHAISAQNCAEKSANSSPNVESGIRSRRSNGHRCVQAVQDGPRWGTTNGAVKVWTAHEADRSMYDKMLVFTWILGSYPLLATIRRRLTGCANAQKEKILGKVYHNGCDETLCAWFPPTEHFLPSDKTLLE